MKSHPRILIAIVVATAVAALVAVLSFQWVPGPYSSPDEAANAFFALQLAHHGSLSAFEPLNLELLDALHPRSMISLDGHLLPVSFLGLPFFAGLLAGVLGDWALPLLTPLVAFAAIFAWRSACKRLFGEPVASISAILLATHGAWLFFSARPLMHNVLFTSFLILAAWFLVAKPLASRQGMPPFIRLADPVLSGLCLGLAGFVRASEAPWIIIVLVFLGIAFWPYRNWRSLALILAGGLIAVGIAGAANVQTYGHPLALGYEIESEALAGLADPIDVAVQPEPAAEGSVRQRVEAALKPLFPFGIHPRAMWSNFLRYGVGMFWWMSALASIGIVWLGIFKKATALPARGRVAYLGTLALAGIWLVTLYGSWNFLDNPDPNSVTVADSHVRYWLPLFVLSTPLAAMGVRWISEVFLVKASSWIAFAASFLIGALFGDHGDPGSDDPYYLRDLKKFFSGRFRHVVAAGLVVLCATLGVWTAFFSSDDAHAHALATRIRAQEIRERALALTEEDAVVITDRSDKLYFPDRRVRVPLRDPVTYALLPRIAELAPLYYHGITFPEKDIAFLNDARLGDMGLRIELVETFDAESLYRIEPLAP